MTATRDITCNLIDRPRPQQAPGGLSMRHLPHGEAVLSEARVAHIAIGTLLDLGCLIDHVRITADQVRIRLQRCPLPRVLERHAVHQWWYELPAPGEAMRGLCWRGVFIEWPVHSSDVPSVEVAP